MPPYIENSNGHLSVSICISFVFSHVYESISYVMFKILSISDEIPCDHVNPCQNGGTCNGTMLSYKCSCDVGHTGSNCESKLHVII